MARGPIRGRGRTRRRDELGPEPAVIPTSEGTTVRRAPAPVPATPTTGAPDALAPRWASPQAEALPGVAEGAVFSGRLLREPAASLICLDVPCSECHQNKRQGRTNTAHVDVIF